MNFVSRTKRISNKLGVFGALILLVIVSSAVSKNFMTISNITNILGQISVIGTIAIGQTYVILTGGIDLSVGSILALSLIFIAGFISSVGVLIAIIIGIGLAILTGIINGIGITYGKLPPFIMTLGMLSVARGIVFIYSNGEPIPIFNNFIWELGGTILGIPYSTIIYFALLIALGLVLTKTPFGRGIYAIGSNEEAAHLSGVPVTRYKVYVYLISGLCAGVASILFASQLGVGTPVAGGSFNIDSITAVVVGGTSLTGGKGTLWGTVVGTLIIGILANILNLTGVSSFIQMLVKGALIIGAVLILQKSND